MARISIKYNLILLLTFWIILMLYFIFNQLYSWILIDYKDFDNDTNVKITPCLHPKLELWSKEYMANYDRHTENELSEYNCSLKPWTVKINQYGIFIYNQPSIHNGLCSGFGVVRRGEHQITYSKEFTILDGNKTPYDFVKAKCILNYKIVITYLSGISRLITIDSRPIPKDKSTGENAMNIMFMGFDSVSQMSMQRNMPKTVEYLEKHLGSVRLKEYNIVGDGTPAALFPILTGMTEMTLPEARKGNNKRVKNMDSFPFIWNSLKNQGYVTQWAEDDHRTGTFTYRFVGFDKQPVDHYMRNFYISSDNSNGKCFGDKNSAENMMAWGESILNVYPDRPVFSFIFHGVYTHNSMTKLSVFDSSFKKQLESMQNSGKLNNTILFIFSDHGIRYTDFRNTIQGKMEERTPYISIRYPDWFRKKYPASMKALKENSNVLTTPFDIHETLLDSLEYSPEKELRPDQGIQQRMSLLRPIDKFRTCQAAAVDAHWCGCLIWKAENVDSKITVYATDHLISYINNLVSKELPGLCHILKVKKILSSNSNKPSKEFLKFVNSYDVDGRYAKLAYFYPKNMLMKVIMVKVLVSPSNGIYEASLKYNYETNGITIDSTSISRINEYGDQPKCIAERYATLRKYCFCK